MADMAQVVVTGSLGIAGVAIGSGLTYWLGALNRRHQEARENETRWYEERLRAYIAFYQAVYEVFFRLSEKKVITDEVSLYQPLLNDLGTVQFVGSPEVIAAAEKTFDLTFERIGKEYRGGKDEFSDQYIISLDDFQVLARKDLGHPSPPGSRARTSGWGPPLSESNSVPPI
jgi:hypothetical protein